MLSRLRLHVGLSALFVPVVLLTGLGIAINSYQRSSDLLLKANSKLMAASAAKTSAEVQLLLDTEGVKHNLERLAALGSARTMPQRLRFVPALRDALQSTPASTSYYAGYANGDRFLLRYIWDDVDRTLFKAPQAAQYVLQTNERSGARNVARVWLFDKQLKLLRTELAPEFATYDPRTRPWFKAAIVTPKPIATKVYRFASTGRLGVTLAQRAADGQAVLAADLRLSTLSALLKLQRITPGTKLALVNAGGGVVALDDFTKMPDRDSRNQLRKNLGLLSQVPVPVLALAGKNLGPLVGELDGGSKLAKRVLRLGGANWQLAVAPIPLVESKTYLVLAVPSDELLEGARTLRRDSILSTLMVIAIALPLVILIARLVTSSLRHLSEEAEAVRHFDFSDRPASRSIVKEVDDLGLTIDGMKSTIRRFLSISSAIAAEPNFERLLERILSESIVNTQAQGGALFLADQGGSQLMPVQAQGADRQPLKVNLTPLSTTSISHVMGQGEGTVEVLTGTISPEGTALETTLAGALQLDGVPYLAMPLVNRDKQLLGLLLFWFQETPDAARVSFTKAFSGTAAVTLETRELIRSQKALFEAFIELIANAIDAKSPYTGGHCYRVPEITKMLAAAAVEAKDGPFKDFQLDEGQWETVHVAAWLHDCGKVTTPEFVVDKATKLETIYDRIHEVRMRFEVLKRDVELSYWEQLAAGGDATVLAAERDASLAQLDDDFAFVAECNQGGEFMAPDRIERLNAIAARTWTRTLDDRLGVSTEELLRKQLQPEVPVPVLEPLLADKPEHRIERPAGSSAIEADNPYGFKVDAPELLYNRGEVYNLSVARGTLSAEERFKINEHIIQTIRMLSALPFPRHMSQVAEIAGGHHETMIGTGYPKRLKREEMSEVARMMAIADIFEALTAVDRPYKKGKTLSQAIKIMTFMKKDQHIDPDLFALFIRSGVYKRYAEKYLKPDQIDAVDEEAVLAA
ncbi:MAG: HD domain-containing phosphohydrolase [Prochlorococcaceae cyanobacterium]